MEAIHGASGMAWGVAHRHVIRSPRALAEPHVDRSELATAVGEMAQATEEDVDLKATDPPDAGLPNLCPLA